MKKYRWQIIIIFLTGIVVGILLLSEQPETPEVLSPENIQPLQGGVYTEALIGNFQRLNPLLDTYNSVDRDVDQLIFSGLVKFDDRGIPSGDLAESWGVSQDGSIYNFTIKESAYWHDGKPVSSQDVAFTVELMRQGGLTIPADIQAFWSDIEVIVLNEKNLQFQLPEPFSPFLDYLTFGLLPDHILGGMDYASIVEAAFNLQPVGTGPYKFGQLIVDGDWIQGVELTVNENYYDETAFIETVDFIYYADPITAWQAYQDGIVQGVSEISPDILDEALADEDLALYASRMPEFTILFINLDNPNAEYLSEYEVRKALHMGVNRQLIVDDLLNGQAVVTDSPILPGTWAYYKVADPVGYDQAAANDLLNQSGYVLSDRVDENEQVDVLRMKDDIFLEINLLYPDDPIYEAMAMQIQSNWIALGIDVSIEAVPYDLLINERLAQRDYEVALLNINLARTPDPDPYPFWNQVQATNGQNYSQWNNRMASEYLEKARVSNDFDERERMYHNFQVIFNQELPSLILYYPVYNYGISKEIQGVSVGPLFDSSGRLANFSDWYLESEFSK